jgi:lysyl-tRNA synthetase, class I
MKNLNEKAVKQIKKEKKEFDLFWADQVAERVIHREKYRYSDKKTETPNEFVSKSGVSVSGVLHIGRLSDTVRNGSVHRSLLDAGVKSKLILSVEDMDPLRKIPKGIPAEFEKYLGMPISMIPDPEGCHESYSKHHFDTYLEVLNEFVFEDLEIHMMNEEYGKGKFSGYITKLVENSDAVREIQNRYRTNPLKKEWSPWNPICEKCNRIITTRITEVDEKTGNVSYVCKDYLFETTIAKGCGHKGVNDPSKAEGKLAYKSEWAAQWKHWKVNTEGAGKEYQVPNSAFWINAEICEKIFNYQSPETFFYEHLTIDGVKMSASLGNVVYPKDWLTVASPQLLRFFYNKRLMTERSFSWKELPSLYEEYDRVAGIYSGKISVENEKEKKHLTRLFEISNHMDKKLMDAPLELNFGHAAMVAQVFTDEADIINSLTKTGHYDKKYHKQIMERLSKARTWMNNYAPEESRYIIQDDVSDETKKMLTQKQTKALKLLVETLKSKEWGEKELYNECYNISKDAGLKPPEFFKAAYLVLLNKERGPKLAPFLLALGTRAVNVLEKV